MMQRPLTPATLALTVFLAAAGCGSSRPQGWSPSQRVAEPTVFAPGVVSTPGAQEFGVAFTPDASAVYFTRRAPGGPQGIWFSRFDGSAWSDPQIAPFSTGVDENPWITSDGMALYFVSRRAGALGLEDASDNLWVVDRVGEGWGAPRPVPGAVNRPRPEGAGWPVGSELSPTLGPDGALYYWTQEPGGGASPDIYRADPASGGFAAGRPLGAPINTEATEASVSFGPGGVMVFQAYGREGGVGGEDLYVSRPIGGGWSRPLPLPINSDANEIFPSFSPDGRYFFFASDREADEGAYSIYFVELSTLGLNL